MGIFDVVNYLVEAANLFVSAIQWAFNQIIIVFAGFYTIFNFITSAIHFIYGFAQYVPSWLWVFALAFISWRLFVFVKSVGGE